MHSDLRAPTTEDMMGLVKWDQSFSVKVQKCDDDHKKLFDLLNQLHDAMKQGHGADVVGKVLDELLAYTKFHFSGEEALLAKAAYPGLATHRAQHQEFVKKINDFRADIKAGKTNTTLSVGAFLMQWLSQHIQKTDQLYSAHLNAAGIV